MSQTCQVRSKIGRNSRFGLLRRATTDCPNCWDRACYRRNIASAYCGVRTDFMSQAKYRLADSSEMVSQKFRIKSLQVGNRILKNVEATFRRPGRAARDGPVLLDATRERLRFPDHPFAFFWARMGGG